MRVIGTRVDVARGSTVDIDVTFSAPPGEHAIVLLPSARAHEVPVVLEGRWFTDALPSVIAI